MIYKKIYHCQEYKLLDAQGEVENHIESKRLKNVICQARNTNTFLSLSLDRHIKRCNKDVILKIWINTFYLNLVMESWMGVKK